MNKNEMNNALDWGTPSGPVHGSFKVGPIINEQNKGVYLSMVSLLGIIDLVGKKIPQGTDCTGLVAVGALGSLLTHK